MNTSINTVRVVLKWEEAAAEFPFHHFSKTAGGFYSRNMSPAEAQVLMASSSITLYSDHGDTLKFRVWDSHIRMAKGEIQSCWIHAQTARETHGHSSWIHCLQDNGWSPGE